MKKLQRERKIFIAPEGLGRLEANVPPVIVVDLHEPVRYLTHRTLERGQGKLAGFIDCLFVRKWIVGRRLGEMELRTAAGQDEEKKNGEKSGGGRVD